MWGHSLLCTWLVKLLPGTVPLGFFVYAEDVEQLR